MARLAGAGRWFGVLLAATMSQPLVAQQSDPIQSAIRGLLVQGTPIRGERILAVPMDGSVGAFGSTRAGIAGPIIRGIVQNHLGELVPRAGNVLIRSIADGEIVATVQVDGLAQFTVREFAPGLYTAQLVDGSANILASTGAFTAGYGEVIQLATVIPATPLTNLPSVLANATESVVSSAASAGVLAMNPGIPISPQ